MRTVNPEARCKPNGPPDGFTWVAGDLGSGWSKDWMGGCGTSPRQVPALPTTYDGGVSNGIYKALPLQITKNFPLVELGTALLSFRRGNLEARSPSYNSLGPTI